METEEANTSNAVQRTWEEIKNRCRWTLTKQLFNLVLNCFEK